MTFSLVHINLPDNYNNCSDTSLSVYDGINLESPKIGQYCSRTLPHRITSQGNALTIFLQVPRIHSSSFGFRAIYSVEETACGGDFIAESGYFASPGYPNSYPQNAECIWRLGGWPGNQITLTFETFGLETSDNCNRDYVEVHEEDEEGRLLGHFCGDTLPLSNITANGKLWVKFNSDQQSVARGFTAFYSLGQFT